MKKPEKGMMLYNPNSWSNMYVIFATKIRNQTSSLDGIIVQGHPTDVAQPYAYWNYINNDISAPYTNIFCEDQDV